MPWTSLGTVAPQFFPTQMRRESVRSVSNNYVVATWCETLLCEIDPVRQTRMAPLRTGRARRRSIHDRKNVPEGGSGMMEHFGKQKHTTV